MFSRSFLLPALMAGTLLLPHIAQAQTPIGQPITLNVSQQSVQTTLRTLFAAAGIRNFVIAPDVQGRVNLSLNDVPYSVALKQVLGAANPPLTADVQDGMTHIQMQKAATPPELIGTSADAPQQGRYTKIGIKHYDAGVMADLATRPGGIVVVPPNFVVPANSNAAATPGPQTAPVAVNNILPDGVQKIYALESDNSLVIEAAPGAPAGLPL